MSDITMRVSNESRRYIARMARRSERSPPMMVAWMCKVHALVRKLIGGDDPVQIKRVLEARGAQQGLHAVRAAPARRVVAKLKGQGR